MTQLLPCPFCGAPAEYDSRRWRAGHQLGHTGHAVYCSAPDCNAENGLHETEEEAVEAWNRRAVSPAGNSISEGLKDLMTRMKAKGYESGSADLKIDLRLDNPFWLSIDTKPYNAPGRRTEFFYNRSLSDVFARAQKWVAELPESETAAMAPWFDTVQMCAPAVQVN